MTAPTTLIEREPEQAALGGVTEAVGTGAGARAVGIVGPPGVGKSELLLVLRDRARDAGFLTLTARASEFEADFPFGIVRSLLGDHLRRLDDGDRDELLSGAAGRLRPLFDLAPAPRHAPAPAAMLHALYWLLTDLQADAPVAFLVDDAHWADPGSLHALAHLLSRGEDLALLVGLSARTGEADSASSAPLDTLDRKSVV